MLSNILLIPAWAFQALGATAGALAGLAHDFSADQGSSVDAVGPALALIAVVGIAWRLARGRTSQLSGQRSAIALTLWAMQAIAPTVFRTPETERFLFPAAVVVLLVAVEAAHGHPLEPGWPDCFVCRGGGRGGNQRRGAS